MKKLLLFLLIMTLFLQTQGQKSYNTDNSLSTALNLLKRDEFKTASHAILSKNVRMVYDWDDENNKPIVIEEGEITVLALVGVLDYYGSFLETDYRKVVSITGLDKKDKPFSIITYTRSDEDDNIFSTGAKRLVYKISGHYHKFGQVKKIKYKILHNDLKFFTQTFLQSSQYIHEGNLMFLSLSGWTPKLTNII